MAITQAQNYGYGYGSGSRGFLTNIMGPYANFRMDPYNAGFNFSSTAWPSANLAIYWPFAIMQPIVFDTFYTMNGATATGTIDMGVYDLQSLNLIKSVGSGTNQTGTTAVQSFTVGVTVLPAGTYLFGMSLSSGSATLQALTVMGARYLHYGGYRQQSTAHPLPSTAVPVALTNDFMPIFGMRAIAQT